jgi:hypothetical protein
MDTNEAYGAALSTISQGISIEERHPKRRFAFSAALLEEA